MRQDNGVSLARGGGELETVSTLFTHVNSTNGHNTYISLKFEFCKNSELGGPETSGHLI